MRWRKVGFYEAVQFMQVKVLAVAIPVCDRPLPPGCQRCGMDAVDFTDGSCVMVESRYTGPYSEVTPDIDPDLPDFWIGEP